MWRRFLSRITTDWWVDSNAASARQRCFSSLSELDRNGKWFTVRLLCYSQKILSGRYGPDDEAGRRRCMSAVTSPTHAVAFRTQKAGSFGGRHGAINSALKQARYTALRPT